MVSQSLCKMNHSLVPDLIETLQRQIDVARIAKIVSDVLFIELFPYCIIITKMDILIRFIVLMCFFLNAGN